MKWMRTSSSICPNHKRSIDTRCPTVGQWVCPTVGHREGMQMTDADHALTGWVRGMAALGMSEARISEEARLARATVRRRLGKR